MTYETVPTPCFVVEEELLIKNLEKLKSVLDTTGCKILLAQKCFSMYSVYPLIRRYLSGTTASGLYEAKLGKEEMGGETHVFSAAYREDEIDELARICDHIVFNSMSQWKKYRERVKSTGVECGLRINPECSTQEGHAIYDPCSPGSRLGITREQLEVDELEGISGLHFHTLCEQNSDALAKTLQAVEEKFGDILPTMKWINFGGGHHITRDDYDVELLITCIQRMQERYGLKCYLEPGEAVAYQAGFLVSTVLDITKNGRRNAILDTSAACHMPDILEMPYTPEVIGAKIVSADYIPKDGEPIYRLGGPTCLAGDIIGDYRFLHELSAGDRVIFCDMAIYSMVKTNTFNGMRLPGIFYKRGKDISMVRQFEYDDFKARL